MLILANVQSERDVGGIGSGQQGKFLKHDLPIPLSNLFVTMLNRLDVPTEQFVDSTGELTDMT